MNFKELLIQAKEANEAALTALLEMYKPLLIKRSIWDGKLDEDLYQELCITLLKCIRTFKV